MNRMIFYPAFAIDQEVKVQVLGFITRGKVIGMRTLTTRDNSKITYEVQFGATIDDRVSPNQEQLKEAQTLPLGELK
jgi:hypothetical protein